MQKEEARRERAKARDTHTHSERKKEKTEVYWVYRVKAGDEKRRENRRERKRHIICVCSPGRTSVFVE